MHKQITLQNASKSPLRYPSLSLKPGLSAQLIINADDFGSDSNINAAIVSCFEKKLINSTTIMVNMKGFEEAVKLASVHGLMNNIGLHVSLTEGKSLTDLSGTGLTDENGNFITGNIFSKPSILLSPSTRGKIKAEINEQFNKLIKSGIYPTHIDSHQHVHTLPLLAPIFIEFVKKHNQRLRLVAIKKRKNIFMNAFNVLLNAHCKRNKIHFTDTFGNVNFFMKCLKEKEVNGVFEIMVHPTYKQGTIIDFLENTDLEKSLTSMIGLYNEKCVSRKDHLK